MNTFFLGLEHLELAGFPFQLMAQESEVVLVGTLNFLTYSNNVPVLQGCMQNLGQNLELKPSINSMQQQNPLKYL